MKPRIPIRAALSDPALFGDVLAGDSWNMWKVLLISAMGERLTNTERKIFQRLTNRETEPRRRVEELIGVVGRRGGKSRAISVLAAYVSGLCDHPALVPGERGVCLIIAPDQKQATICLDYIAATFEASPILRQLIESRTQGTLRLTNKIDIEVRASYFRHLRGPTYIGVVCDEVVFFHSENSSNPDTEILNAVRPGLATTHGPLFLISSPYARKGELWRTFKRHWGNESDPLILVAKGTSREFNSTLPQSVVDRAIERDESAARAEFLAEFRKDIESFVSIEAVTACVSAGVYERSPQRNIRYHGFVDPSGGSSDSFTLAIGHVDFAKQVVIVDAVREVRPPFSPEGVVVEFTKILNSYRVATIQGDRYAGDWPVEQFSKCGIKYEQSAKPKRDLYTDLLPLINSRRIELLDDTKLIAQLTNLERRTARGGRDSIDHPPTAHDDVANAVAGIAAINNQFGGFDTTYQWANGRTDGDEDPNEAWRRLRLQTYLESHGQIKLW